MNKVLNMINYILAFLLIVIPLVSCSGGGGGTGSLGIGLTDAPGDYEHVFVTIDEVQVKQGLDDGESGWLTGFSVGQTFDLLELQNGIIADLGLAELEAGQYNQIRLILASEEIAPHPFANYLVIEGEQEEEYIIGETGEYYTIQELKVPSGLQTGIKIVQGFTIEVGGSTELILDFDAKKSVVQAGKSGQWLLKPTIKVLETVTYSVSGVVNTIVDDVSVPLNGVTVSAHIYDSVTGASDEINGTETAVIGENDGAYFMHLPVSQDVFNIMALMDGYLPECQVLDASTDGIMAYENFNLTLTPADATGTFTATVAGVATADFRIRQMIECGSGEVMIEVAFVSVADGATSTPITLPVGTYEVVVSPAGEDTYVVEGGMEVMLDTNTDVAYPPTP